jgi:hypothetical protein
MLEIFKQIVLTPIVFLFLFINISHMIVEYLSKVHGIDYYMDNWHFIFHPVKCRKIIKRKLR